MNWGSPFFQKTQIFNFYLRLDQSFSLESQGDSLRDTYERHKLADAMKMPGYIGYGDKKNRESFSGAGILNSHPWPLIEGTTTTTCSMNRWNAKVAPCFVKWFTLNRTFYMNNCKSLFRSELREIPLDFIKHYSTFSFNF